MSQRLLGRSSRKIMTETPPSAEARTAIPLHERKQSVLYKIPIVNVLFEALFDDSPPDLASLKDFLNTIGLVAALLLTVVMSVPSSVTYDEIQDVVERFRAEPYRLWEDLGDPGRIVVDDLLLATVGAVCGLANAVNTVVILLMVIPCSGDYLDTDAHYLVWWKWSRWLVMWAFANCVAGVIAGFFSFTVLMKIKFPDFNLESGAGEVTQDGENLFTHAGLKSSFNFFRQMTIFFMGLPFIVTFLIISIANIAVINNDKAESQKERQKGSEGTGSKPQFPEPPLNAGEETGTSGTSRTRENNRGEREFETILPHSGVAGEAAAEEPHLSCSRDSGNGGAADAVTSLPGTVDGFGGS